MKLAEALRIAQSPSAGQSERFSVFLATGFEALHLPTFLTAHLRQRLGGRPVNVVTGVFGDLFSNIERLSKSDCPAAATVIEWTDLDPRLGLRALGGWSPALLSDIRHSVEK